MISLLLAIAGVSLAQDYQGLDAHGFKLTSLTSSTTAPLRVYQPQTFEAGDWYGGFVAEFAKEPLTLGRREAMCEVVYYDGLDNLLAINLGAGVAVHERLRLELGLPVYALYSRDAEFSSLDPAPGLGDLRVAGHVALVRREADATGLSLGLVPFLDLPTGMEEQMLGQAGPAGGGRLALSLDAGRVVVGGDAGLLARPATAEALNLENPTAAELGLHAGLRMTETLGVNLESTSAVPFASNSVPGTETPSELTGTLRGAYDSGLTWVAGGAGGVSWGAGTADWRVFFGLGLSNLQKKARPEPVVPKGAITVEVTLDGRRVADAPVDVSGTQPTNLVSGTEPVLYGNLTPGDVYTATATNGPCMVGEGTATVVADQTTPLIIPLTQKLSAQVRLEIYDADDKPLNGGVVTWEREVESCVPGEPWLLKESHTGRQSVGVGQHTVFVTVEDYNTFAASVTLEEGDDELIIVQLKPTRVQVTAERIEILEKVYFEFDGDQVEERSAELLDEVANVLRRNPDILQVEVAGHTDSKGSNSYNEDLSQRRVESVRAWLIAKGVAEERLIAKGYGESEPIAPNSTAAGRAKNRRVEFTILERAPLEDGAGTIIRMEDGDGPTQEQIDSGEE